MFFEWYWANLMGFLVQVISSAAFTVWVHRAWCHRSITVTTGVANFSRVWLWAVGWYWPNLLQHFSAMHRKHHKLSDTPEDPHSPLFYTFKQLVFAKANRETPKDNKLYYMPDHEVLKWASDVPKYNDWLEQNIFVTNPKRGPLIFALTYLILFGPLGMLNGIIWIYFTRISPRLHNYMSHKIGYRTQESKHQHDKSVNIVPIGFFWGGEELGANHHDDPQSPRFSRRWYEFDIGWLIVLVLAKLDLVEFIDGEQLKGKWYSCLFKKELNKATKK
jgi:stearoyl-CoA desaturase (delta-9 desaturase)